MKVGVVGHVEAVEFVVVERLPRGGEIVHAREAFGAPAGGGAVAAVQVLRLAGDVLFLCAVGDDAAGEEARRALREDLGVPVHAATRERAQRRAITFLAQDDGERTITILGERLVPHGDDPLPWDALRFLDAVYLTGGDVAAVMAARAAKVLVATPRAMPALGEAGVEVDVLVGSGTDEGERDEVPAGIVVRTFGSDGVRWTGREEGSLAAPELPGEIVDTYGAGDTFAAALTVGFGAGLAVRDAVAYAARAGAACLTGRGPYGADVGALVGPP